MDSVIVAEELVEPLTEGKVQVAEHTTTQPSVVPSTSGQDAGAVAVASRNRSRVLSRLLAMADGYRISDSLHQAIELYFNIVENHESTPEAEQAEDRLLDVAREFESNSEPHAARSIYERLLKNEE